MDHIFTIYSLGDALFLQNIFNAIAMITHGSAYQEGNFIQLCVIGGMVGFILTAFKGLLTGKAFELPSFITSILVWLFFFGWSATVNVHDVFSEEDRAVDNVPGGVAFVGWVFSSIGYELANEFELALQSPDQTSTLTEGGIYADSVRTLNALTTIGNNPSVYSAIDADNNSNSNFKTSAENYIRECSMTAIDLGYKTNDDLMTKPVSNVSADNAKSSALGFPEGGNVYFTQLCDGNGSESEQGCRIVTCAEAYSALDSILNNAYNGQHTREVLANTIQVPSASSTTGSSKGDLAIQRIDDIFKMVSSDGQAAQNFIKASIYYDLLPIGAANSALTAKDRTSALMLAQARLQRNVQWSGEGNMFQQVMRPVMTFIEVFAYAISPLVGFLVLLGKFGIKLATTYFMLIAWVQTWLPCLAIANNFINSTVQRSLLEFGGMSNTMGRSLSSSGSQFIDSFYAVKRISDISQDTISTAGMFVGAIPLLSLFVLYGSIYTLNSLTGRMSAGEFINEKISAPDLLSPAAVMQGMSQMTSRSGIAWGTSEEQALGMLSYRVGGLTSEQSAIERANGISNIVNSGFMNTFGNAYAYAQSHGDSNVFQDLTSAMTQESKSALAQVGQKIGNAMGFSLNESEGLRMGVAAGLGGDFKGFSVSGNSVFSSSSDISAAMNDSLSNELNTAMGNAVQSGFTDGMQNAYANSDAIQQQMATNGIDQQQFSDSITSQKSQVTTYSQAAQLQANRGYQASMGIHQFSQLMENNSGKRAFINQEFNKQAQLNQDLVENADRIERSLKATDQNGIPHLAADDATVKATAQLIAMTSQGGTLGDDAQTLAGQLINGEVVTDDGQYSLVGTSPDGGKPAEVKDNTGVNTQAWKQTQDATKDAVTTRVNGLGENIEGKVPAGSEALNGIARKGEERVVQQKTENDIFAEEQGRFKKAEAILQRSDQVYNNARIVADGKGANLYNRRNDGGIGAIMKNLSDFSTSDRSAEEMKDNMKEYRGWAGWRQDGRSSNGKKLTTEAYADYARNAGTKAVEPFFGTSTGKRNHFTDQNIDDALTRFANASSAYNTGRIVSNDINMACVYDSEAGSIVNSELQNIVNDGKEVLNKEYDAAKNNFKEVLKANNIAEENIDTFCNLVDLANRNKDKNNAAPPLIAINDVIQTMDAEIIVHKYNGKRK